MGMTMSQKILASHAGLDSVEAGQLIEAKLDLVLGNDITSPVAIHEMDKMTVKDVKKGITYSVDCDKDYQPQLLINSGDTVGYFNRFYSSMAVAPANYIFNFEHRGALTSSCVTYRFTYNKYSLNPDSLHICDSIFYYDNQKLTRKLALSYGEQDNRHQSVDANQLLLGVEACDPYLLASLFRYARNTSIIAEAKNDKEKIQVSATLNADKSIHQLMVRRDDETITYTFNY